MATAKTLLKRALEKDELFEFLEGRENYHVDYSALAVNYHPTDFRLIARVMNAYYGRKKESELPEKLVAALQKCLAEDTLFDLYCAFSVVYQQLYLEGKGKASFTLDREFVSALRARLMERQDALREYGDFEGYGKPQGAWSLVMEYNSKLHAMLGIGLIEEK